MDFPRQCKFMVERTVIAVVALVLICLYACPLHAAVVPHIPSATFTINKVVVWTGALFLALCTLSLVGMALNISKRRKLEAQLFSQINQYQQSQEELQATEEMLRAQVDDYLQSQEELQVTEEQLRNQINEYRVTYDQLLATEEMLRVQLDVVEESSQKFKAVFEYSPIAVTLASLPHGALSEVNQAFVEMFGYTREEAVGKTTGELALWRHEADRECYLDLLQQHGYVHNFEVEMRRENGALFTVLFSGARLEIAGKAMVLSTVMDITEQQRLQNQLFQTQKMDVVGQLAGGIAHDFNNMLTGIMAAAEMLKKHLPYDERNSKMVDMIIHASSRSADLTRELLTFSRKGESVSVPVNVHEIIANVISLLERTIDKQIQLVTRFDDCRSVVMGDQTQLQNALLNLGVNARDAMPQGGALTYATSLKELDQDACHALGGVLTPGRYLEITVSDTGVGMTQTVMEHIFEPFYTTKGIGKGTGLGLAAVYGTARSHKGEVSVQSQPSVGTVFRIYLPLVEKTLHAAITPSEVVVGSGVILLVDDEKILRDVGCELLEELGYTVYLAGNGAEALELFAIHRSEIKLVMLDMIMPKMGGKETFLRLRELDPAVKVLLCSGFNFEENSDEPGLLGADGYVQKPYNRSELSRMVAELMPK